ncbi:MAG: tetratricopeptide repeat protein [Prevotella sp.]|jgi:tetratricopeptide (TPR) repeat protein|nr:tetratricopeptide repeat protein [Prevotella sp.]
MVEKSQKSRLIHLWWFAAILFIVAAGISAVSIYNTRQIIERAEKNQSEMVETFRYLRAEPQWKLAADSLGRQYIDSVKAPTSEQVSRIETLLIGQATRQLTEYSDTLVKESGSLHNTLLLWAAVLTLLSIIFTFLGFMELRERFSIVEDKRHEMNEAIDDAIEKVSGKMQEVYSVLTNVDAKRSEIDAVLLNAQDAIADITNKFEELSVSTIEDMDDKIKEIARLTQAVKEAERTSAFELDMASALALPTASAKLKAFDELNSRICLDTVLSTGKKSKLWAELHFHIAGILSEQEKSDIAIEHYDKAIALDATPAMYNNRGKEYSNKGYSEKAIADYNKAIQLYPDAYNNRGDYYAYRGDFERAIDNYNKAIDLNPDYTAAIYSRGQAYAQMEEHENAIADYNKALNDDPTSAKLYYLRGISHQKLNMIEEALDDFERSIELDPHNLTGCQSDSQAEINRIKEVEEE